MFDFYVILCLEGGAEGPDQTSGALQSISCPLQGLSLAPSSFSACL